MMLFIERVVIPGVMLIGLIGGVAGLSVGCALMVNHAATLRFIAGVNRWVSTQEAFARLERPIVVEPPPSASARRALGALFLLSGMLGAALLLWRLDFAGLKSSPLLLVVLETARWTLVAGNALAVVVGGLMIGAPQRLARLELKLNDWRSTEQWVVAGERMHTPLEPIVEKYPRASGLLIALACLWIALAMGYLLLANLR